MSRQWPRVRRWLPTFLAAVAIRVVYWISVTPHWRPNADADQYVQLSRALAAGRGFALQFPQLEVHATAFRPPLYPVLLTPGALVFGDALWPGRLLSVLLGSTVVVLAGVLAARVGGRTAGLATAALVAIYPPLLANDTITLTEPLSLLLLLGAILLLDDARFVGAGLTIGLLLLTRPNGYLVVAIFAGWAWQRAGLRKGLIVGGCALAVLLPWLVRNQVQVGTWHPTTSDGFTLAATYGMPAQEAETFIDPVFSHRYDDPDHRLNQFDEAVWNERLTHEAIDAIRAHPGYVRTLVRKNAEGYFEVRPDVNRYPERNDGRSWPFRQTTRPLFFLVTAVGLIGLVRFRSDSRIIVLLLLTAQFLVLSLLLVAPPRLRAPFDLTMCIGAGLLVGQALAARRRSPASPFEGSAVGS